jgi:RHS repeat-associated protein
VSGTSNCPACGSSRPVSAIDSANSINYATNAHFTAWGALSSMTNGSVNTSPGYFPGIYTTNTYNLRMQPQTLTAHTPLSTIMSLGYNLNYGAGDNGNVVSITNSLNSSRSQSFTYDYLNRLTSGQSSATSGVSCWGEGFGYDMWANLNIRNVSKCAAEGPVPTATTSNRMSTYSYDTAGNLLTASGGSYGYDAENRMVSAPGVTFDYDADGRRVEKSSGTLYWYGKGDEPLLETDLSGNLKSEYVFFDGRRIARRDSSSNVFYYFEDSLGSSRIITNSGGGVCYDADFFPFGAEQNVYLNTCPQNYKFTGKERDPETGLDDFEARYYSSALGRFITPDWSAKPEPVPYANFENPQSLNQYLYVTNNPETLTDPNGHDGFTIAADFVTGFLRGYDASVSMGAIGSPQQGDSTASKIGQTVGSTVETLQGVETFSGGAGLTGGGLAAEGPSLGTSTAAVAGGVGMMALGSTMAAGGIANLMRVAQGGTYVLTNPKTGNVERSGRTNDLERREGEHARGEETKDLKFKVDKRTNSANARRGREQELHDKHNPSLNKIRPISPTNPNKSKYMKAAKKLH